MTRLPDWEIRLRRFLEANRGRPFRWGSWDCCMFAAAAVREITGVDLAAAYRGRYQTMIGAFRLTGGSTLKLAEAVASANGLERYSTAGEARAGDVVMGDVQQLETLGVLSPLGLAVFSTATGLADYPRGVAKRAWRIG